MTQVNIQNNKTPMEPGHILLSKLSKHYYEKEEFISIYCCPLKIFERTAIYFYNETLKTLTLSGTYISGDYKGESRTSSFTVLSLSETDLVLQFVAEEGLITYHYKRVK